MMNERAKKMSGARRPAKATAKVEKAKSTIAKGKSTGKGRGPVSPTPGTPVRRGPAEGSRGRGPVTRTAGTPVRRGPAAGSRGRGPVARPSGRTPVKRGKYTR